MLIKIKDKSIKLSNEVTKYRKARIKVILKKTYDSRRTGKRRGASGELTNTSSTKPNEQQDFCSTFQIVESFERNYS